MAKRQQEVKCEPVVRGDGKVDFFHVWADSDMEGRILQVEGIYNVDRTGDRGFFTAYLDLRYDAEEVAKEIEALVK